VRQSAKRTKVPDVLDVGELRMLLAELRNPARTVVFLTAATGLRISEALALKWSDVDFASGSINLSRAVVHQQVGEMKTEASQKPNRLAIDDAKTDFAVVSPKAPTVVEEFLGKTRIKFYRTIDDALRSMDSKLYERDVAIIPYGSSTVPVAS